VEQGEHEQRGDLGSTPAEYFLISSVQASTSSATRVNTRALIDVLWSRAWIPALGAIVGMAVFAAYAFLIAEPIYRVETLVAPRDASNSQNGVNLGQQIGGLASLAGINLNLKGTSSAERIATLSSRSVARAVVVKENLLPTLFSSSAHSLFRISARNPPTVDDAVEYFVKNVRHIEVDDKTGLVTVVVLWKDPAQAAQWAGDLVELTNKKLQQEAIADATKNIEFLEAESKQATLDSLRQAIVSLLETNLNQEMLANVQSNYAFKTIDPPVVPEANQFVSPQRSILVVVGLLLGALAACMLIVWPQRRRIWQSGPRSEIHD
jgi:uncharacterized protein involved in exopolysaccharide biosynthesis